MIEFAIVQSESRGDTVGRAIPVWVGERFFESKSEAENEVKRIWNSYEIGQDVTDPDDIQFLGDLVAKHHAPETKIGPGIEGFVVSTNSYAGNWERKDRCIKIRQIGNPELVEFSAPDAAKGTPRTHAARVREALSNESREITGRIREAAFETGGEVRDPDGTLILERSDAEVRRRNPTLKELAESFLESRSLTYDDVRVDNLNTTTERSSGRKMRGFVLADGDLAEAWFAYQDARAHLLVVTLSSQARRRYATKLQDGA